MIIVITEADEVIMACCTVSARAKFVYIVEWIVIALATLGLIGAVIFYCVKFDQIVDDAVNRDHTLNWNETAAVLKIFIILFGVLGSIGILLEVVLNTVLTKGVNSRYHKYCKIWFVIQIILLVLACLGMIMAIVNIARGNEPATNLVTYIVSILYRILTLKFIKDFMGELIEDSRTGRVYSAP